MTSKPNPQTLSEAVADLDAALADLRAAMRAAAKKDWRRVRAWLRYARSR